MRKSSSNTRTWYGILLVVLETNPLVNDLESSSAIKKKQIADHCYARNTSLEDNKGAHCTIHDDIAANALSHLVTDSNLLSNKPLVYAITNLS